jgi:hypothetical protein
MRCRTRPWRRRRPEVLPSSSAAGFGNGIRSTLPANQAAGSSTSDSTTKPARPARQPYPSFSICPSGADNSAPSDPAAETMPSTVLRTAVGTARAATDIAMAAAVHASDVPISTPAPSMTPSIPCALAISTSPAIYRRAPTIMMLRKPYRTVNAPASGCRKPQARFCTAMARVKSDTEIPTSRVSGCRKMPSDWRRPMLRLSISEAPIRTGKVGRSTRSRDMFVVLSFGRGLRVAFSLITPICVSKIWTGAVVKAA